MKQNIFYLIIVSVFLILNNGCKEQNKTTCDSKDVSWKQIKYDTALIIQNANDYLLISPSPITLFTCKRSAGNSHDFYSEGDYWWPNPADLNGAYIRKDGKTNPENFTAHRKAMRNLNKWVGGLVAAYILTKDEKYAQHAMKHLKAFFLNPNTLMNPNLLFAQAIKGKVTGRGIGIIDTIHLIEVAKAIEELIRLGFITGQEKKGLKDWFEQYASWMNTHPYGLKEKNHGNNHSTWWAAQMAAFSHLSQDKELMKVAISQFKKVLSNQMAQDGSFPDELKRTKPYNYTLFNLEGYAVICQIASTPEESLWHYNAGQGSIEKAWDFMMPFIEDKSKWIRPPDIQHFEELPIQSSGIVFAALAYSNKNYMKIWKGLTKQRISEEVNRNFPIREPILWLK